MQDFPVRCAAMTGALRSAPSAAARYERSSRVVRQVMNASKRRFSASLPISSVLLPPPNLRVGIFPVTNLGAISHHGEAALHTAFSRPRTAVFPAMPTIHPLATCCLPLAPNAASPLQGRLGGCPISPAVVARNCEPRTATPSCTQHVQAACRTCAGPLRTPTEAVQWTPREQCRGSNECRCRPARPHRT